MTADTATSLVASAARVNARSGYRPRSGQGNWQEQGWIYYDITGELRYACSWVGSALSRARLYPKRRNPDGTWTEVTDGVAAEAMNELFGGPAGQAQMLANLGVHLTVPGEAYIVASDDDDGSFWHVASTSELTHRAGKWSLDRGDGKKYLDDDALIVRIWRPHPKRHMEADSPVRALLPVLRELEQLTKHVNAQVESRLAGAGILFLAQEMSFAAPPGAGDAVANTDDPFLNALTDAMLTPIADRESAAAVVPIVVKVPAEHVDKAHHMTFSTPLDETAMQLRNEAIRRLALGLDMPPEILLGTGNINHWSAWQIEEAALKTHIEPLLELITAGLADGFLNPAIEALGGDTAIYGIGYDTSSLQLRPNRSQEALQVFDRAELSGDALRRETGFDDSDKPTESDYAKWVLQKIATGNPNLATEALRALGITINSVQVDEDTSDTGAVPIRSGVPEGVRSDQRDLPELESSPVTDRGMPAALDAVTAAAEVFVFRALERAGNRLRTRHRAAKIPGAASEAYLHVIPEPDDVDDLLADAWSHVEPIAERLGVDPQWLTARLNAYCCDLLVSGSQHDPDALCGYLCQESGDG